MVVVIAPPALHNSRDCPSTLKPVWMMPLCCSDQQAWLYASDVDRLSKNNFQEISMLWVTWLQNIRDGFKYGSTGLYPLHFLLPKEKWKIIWIKLICSSSGKKSLHPSLSIYSESRFESGRDSLTSAVTAPALPTGSSIVFCTLFFQGLELVRDKAGRPIGKPQLQTKA